MTYVDSCLYYIDILCIEVGWLGGPHYMHSMRAYLYGQYILYSCEEYNIQKRYNRPKGLGCGQLQKIR